MRRIGSIVVAMALLATACVVVSATPARAVDIGPAPGACPQMALGEYPVNHAHCVRTSEYASVTTDVGDVTVGSLVTFTMNLNVPACPTVIANRSNQCAESLAWDYTSPAVVGPGQRPSFPTGTMFRFTNGTIVTQTAQPGANANVNYYQSLKFAALPNVVDEHGNIPNPTCIYGNAPTSGNGLRCQTSLQWNQGVGPLPTNAWIIAFPAVRVALDASTKQDVPVETALKFSSTPPTNPPLIAAFTP